MDKRNLNFFIISILLLVQLSFSKDDLERSQFLTKELSVLEKTTVCSLLSLSRKAVHHLWLMDETDDETILCILKLLETSTKEDFVWSLAGSAFDGRGAKKQADFCFKQSTKLNGKHSPFIKEWSYIGPFVIGKTEFDGDPLYVSGGIVNASRYRFKSKPSETFFSELVTDGVVRWSLTRQTQMGSMVEIRPSVDWNDLVSSLGSLGVTEWQGWAVGDLVVNEDNLHLAFQCLGVARCIVAYNQFTGDLYHRDHIWTSLRLKRGVHQIFVPLRAKVAAKFKFLISQKPSTVKLFPPAFMPDLYDGYLPEKVYISVPVNNAHPDKWLKITNVKLMDQLHGESLHAELLKGSGFTVAPGQTLPIIVKLNTKVDGSLKFVDKCDEINFQLRFTTSEGSKSLKLTLRCRERGSSFLFTFIDHDGSVQHAAAIEPIGRCHGKHGLCPTVLSLHGTTVPPQNQADSYKRMVDGNFQFGVNGMWLLAPTRHGAHNWEGPGALTAMQALDALHALTADRSIFNFQADTQHILFAGHSMGGHGAWHLATRYPDRAIGLVSLAGWISKEEYGDSNLFFRHDIANSFTDPQMKAIMEASVAQNDVDKHVTNLKGIPILTRIGGNDRTVHPYFVRRMVRVLKQAGVDVTYSELPDLEHWWWDTKETNDGGCMNDNQIRKFFNKCLKDVKYNSPSTRETCSKTGGTEKCEDGSVESLYVEEAAADEEVTLTVINPSIVESLKGVVVLVQKVPHRMSTVKIRKSGKYIFLTIRNVECLQIKDTQTPNRSWRFDNVKINGKSIKDLKTLTAPYIFCRNYDNQWFYSSKMLTDRLDFDPPHGLVGCVSEKPFLIVVGTQEDALTRQTLLQHAVYIANQFYSTSDTFVEIAEDHTVDAASLDGINIIVIGNPSQNLHTSRILKNLPDLDITEDSVRTGRCSFTSEELGVLALAPNGKSNSALILMGTSLVGLSHLVKLATPTIPPMARSPFSNLLPHFVVTGPDTFLKGPGGFLCSGFWNEYWRFSEASAFCSC